MIIPKADSKPQAKEQKVSILIYGAPMVGKTYFANSFPTPLFFNTDGNTQDIKRDVIDLRNKQMVQVGNNSGEASKWNLFKAYVKNFELGGLSQEIKKEGYETIVIDVLDHLYDWCREAVLSSRGLEDESNDTRPFAPIYNEIKKEFKTVVISLIESIKDDFNLVLTSFESQEEYQEGLDKKFKRVPSIKKKMENSQGIDRTKIFEAITSRINITTGVFIVLEKVRDEEKGTEETKEVRASFPFSSKDFDGGNRLGITNAIHPTYQSLKQKIEEKGK